MPDNDLMSIIDDLFVDSPTGVAPVISNFVSKNYNVGQNADFQCSVRDVSAADVIMTLIPPNGLPIPIDRIFPFAEFVTARFRLAQVVSVDDSGTYQCKAVTREGTSVSAAQLLVKGK